VLAAVAHVNERNTNNRGSRRAASRGAGRARGGRCTGEAALTFGDGSRPRPLYKVSPMKLRTLAITGVAALAIGAMVIARPQAQDGVRLDHASLATLKW